MAREESSLDADQVIRSEYNESKQAMEVGSKSIEIDGSPTLDTSAYSNGDRLGSIITLAGVARENGGGATLQEISLLDNDAQGVSIEFLFFNASPTVASADNAAIDISDSEMASKWIGSALIDSTSTQYPYRATASNKYVTVPYNGLCLNCAAGSTTIYCLMVVRSGTPTFTASGLVPKFKFYQD